MSRAALRRTRRDAECVICHEALELETDELAITACEHVFHGECFTAYSRHAFGVQKQRLEDIASACAFVDEDVVGIATTAALQLEGGPPCPMCRAVYPMRHQLALRLQDKRRGAWGLMLDALGVPREMALHTP